jgi:hypothetical protein
MNRNASADQAAREVLERLSRFEQGYKITATVRNDPPWEGKDVVVHFPDGDSANVNVLARDAATAIHKLQRELELIRRNFRHELERVRADHAEKKPR